MRSHRVCRTWRRPRLPANVLSTQEREGAGAGAKRYADAQFGDVASAAVLTRSQERARAAFRFPRVLSQVAILPTPDFSADAPAHGGPSEAERAARWATWEILVHEYFHTLAHPAFSRAADGNRILTEGFCELFTKAVLDGAGAINTAKDDADASLRIDVEGGDWPGFNPDFIPEYDPGSYADYLTQAESITAAVGVEAARAAFFLGRVELIGVNPDGSMVDPSAPDAAQEVGPGTVDIPDNITSVTGVSIMTGAGEAEIIAANTSLVAGAPLPASAHTDGLTVPGTSFHRVVASSDRRGRAAETKELIARQHGITEAVMVRANPHLNHREPREGEWLLIRVH